MSWPLIATAVVYWLFHSAEIRDLVIKLLKTSCGHFGRNAL